MEISTVSIQDIKELSIIAESAVLTSVIATMSEKKEILESINEHINEYCEKDNSIFLKCSDGNTLGFILIKDCWNLSDFFVSPDSHQKGIGRTLFKGVIDICKKHNNAGFIRVNASHNAVEFYRQLGFKDFVKEKALPHFVTPLIYHF